MNLSLHNREVRIGVDSGQSALQEMACAGIKKLNLGAGGGVLPTLPGDENRYASGCDEEVERWCDTNCARAMDSAERRAYGEQRKRKLEKW